MAATPPPIEGEGYLSGAAAPDAGVGATLFVKELGEALEHDAAQLLGVDDRHGAAVVSGHVVADADRSELDLAKRSMSWITGAGAFRGSFRQLPTSVGCTTTAALCSDKVIRPDQNGTVIGYGRDGERAAC